MSWICSAIKVSRLCSSSSSLFVCSEMKNFGGGECESGSMSFFGLMKISVSTSTRSTFDRSLDSRDSAVLACISKIVVSPFCLLSETFFRGFLTYCLFWLVFDTLAKLPVPECFFSLSLTAGFLFSVKLGLLLGKREDFFTGITFMTWSFFSLVLMLAV